MAGYNDLSISCPPPKKRRIIPNQSVTDLSLTPSPPITPTSNSLPLIEPLSTLSSTTTIPNVYSSPIKNYFTKFTNNNDNNKTNKKNNKTFTNMLKKKNTPRTIWKNTPNPIIPFPSSPSSSANLNNFIQNSFNINYNKYDSLYHPSGRHKTITNIFDPDTLTYYDKHPFLDPDLQLKMRDNAFKILLNIKDNNMDPDMDMDIDHRAMEILNNYGDTAITKVLNITYCDDKYFELGSTDILRAKQFLNYLLLNSNDNNSYNNMCEAIINLGGILEEIMVCILDNAGYLAQSNHSITYNNGNCNTINKFVIRPLHIRHTLHDCDSLFWLQQSIQTNDIDVQLQAVDNNSISDSLNPDCIYYISSFFCGDLPMLSSLARVNTKFYSMTSHNHLWKPIMMRCFLFNQSVITKIESNNSAMNDVDDDFIDFRSYISFSINIKLTILRERWISQNISTDKYSIFVRINPIYVDLHNNLYDLIYLNGNDNDCDIFLNNEIYDLFHQILEIFGTRNDFITITDILNNIKLFNYNEIQQILLNSFKKLTKYEQDTLIKLINIEYNNNDNNDDSLFIQMPLSQNCVNKYIDADQNKHYLWIGRNIVLFAAIPPLNIKHM